MTLLVVGASGLLGAQLCREALARAARAGATATGPVVGTYHRRPGDLAGVAWHRLDLRNRAAVADLVAAVRPTVVINCGYRYDEWAVTADGAAHVAAASAATGARLVHVSSDAVHAGRPAAYSDGEPPTPVFAYGAAKAAAETAVRVLDPSAVVVRTSLILGDADSQQIRLCLDLLTGRTAGFLFSDEVRCPVAVTDRAAAVWELAG
ncbi:MAG TPA: sugar nucleotide-binding protein, partial [Micromonosporaceae bacterium]